MRIALVSSTPVPRARGGMDRLLEGLHAALRRKGPADLIALDVDERSREGVLRGYRDFYRLDLSAYDCVISCKAPAFMVEHPHHVGYLSHRLRVFYDRFEPGGAEHGKMRDLVRWMDDWALDPRRIPHLWTIGETVSRRLREYGGHASRALHCPTTFRPAEPRPGEHFLAVGRLHPWKRTDLIVRAFRASRADCPLKIVGEGPQEAELRELAGGDSRVEFLGAVDEARLAELYAGALATIFIPIDEDLGLITFESFLSGKPVLTARDAGEPALIVEEGRTGYVADPTPEALAARIDAIWADRDAAAAMAPACIERVKPVTWDRVADQLIEAAGKTIEASPSPAAAVRGRSRSANGREVIQLLVTDNQIIDPPVGGGRVRIFELYRHMPADFNTTYLGAFDYPGPAFRDRQFAPNFREILVPLTAPHFRAHHALARLTGGDATVDVTMPLLGGLTPRYKRELKALLPAADVLIGAHPWMFPFFPESPGIPLVYDSQNCEADVKGPLLRATLGGRYLARRVERAERLAVRRGRLVLACSDEDAAAFASRYGAAPERILLVPNGVDCAAIRPASAAEREAARAALPLGVGPFAIFTGSNYVPNLEGAAFIVRELAPAFPAVQFGIVGGVGPMFVERYGEGDVGTNVHIFGFVEAGRLRDLYRAADLALNPMAQGSGTNIKMLDFMAAGLPILTTAVGARGLRGRAGEHWIQAPLDGWAGELGDLIENGEARRELGAGGRALAEAHYDWTSIAARLAEALRALVAESRAGAAP